MSDNAIETGFQTDPRAALWPNYSPPGELVFSRGSGSELFTEDPGTNNCKNTTFRVSKGKHRDEKHVSKIVWY